MPMAPGEQWWRNAVVYQVYIRSFADGNGDGTGDLAGLQSRLGYLRDLGVDAIWVNPWYRSPNHDGGYDVSDYRDIDPRYGSVADAEAFVAAAHQHGIRIIADLVPNHSSDEHRWFQEALTAPPGSAARTRYHFRTGSGPGGELPPNNWTAVFGGPAWEQTDDGEWYLHLFHAAQPDLNWDNAEVRDELDSVLRFWLDRGIDGFRVDVAHGLIKDPAYPDLAEDTELLGGARMANHPHWDRDGVHDLARRWRSVLDDYGAVMVAEAWVEPERLSLYLRPDEYHQSFNFEYLELPWDASELSAIIGRSLDAAVSVGSTPTWVLSNHDVVRHATRLGLPAGTNTRTWLLDGPHDALDPARGLRRARAVALLTLALPGSAYLYQGEELGLPEAWDLPTEVLDDPVWEMSGHKMKGRDGSRVPLPWTAEGPSLGFGAVEPWLPQPAEFADLSVARQTGDPDSTLELHRRALAARRDYLVGNEELEWLDLGEQVIGFRRDRVVCLANLGPKPVALPAGRILAISAPTDGEGGLPTDAAAWVLSR